MAAKDDYVGRAAQAMRDADAARLAVTQDLRTRLASLAPGQVGEDDKHAIRRLEARVRKAGPRRNATPAPAPRRNNATPAPPPRRNNANNNVINLTENMPPPQPRNTPAVTRVTPAKRGPPPGMARAYETQIQRHQAEMGRLLAAGARRNQIEAQAEQVRRLRAQLDTHKRVQVNSWTKTIENQERKKRENQAMNRTMARMVNAGVAAVPDPRTPEFQAWLKRLFSTQAGTVRPTLLAAMRTPGPPAYRMLERLANGVALEDPCGKTPSPSVSSLQAHQAVIHVMAQLRAAGRIDTSGLLVMHSTGAGKTLSGLATMLAFWNTDTPIVLLSTNDNRVHNSPEKFARDGMLMFADFEDLAGTRPFARPPGAGEGYWNDPVHVKRVARYIETRLRRGIRSLMRKAGRQDGELTDAQKSRSIYTFIELGNDIQNGVYAARGQGAAKTWMTDCVFIVDEIQYIMSPPATEMAWSDRYDAVRAVLGQRRDPKTTWCVGMTATPGETKEEVVGIMNIVQGPVADPMRPGDDTATLRRKAMGHVSYAYLLGDRSRFASVRMRLQCSYLSDARGRKSYYHVPYVRRVMRLAQHEQYPANAKAFVDSLHASLSNGARLARVPAPQAHYRNAHWWQYGADPAKTDSYLKPLRRLTLYVPLDKQDMAALKTMHEDGGNSNNENNAGAPKRTAQWPIRELVVSVAGGSAAAAAENDTANNSSDERNGLNAEYLDMHRPSGRRSGRVATGSGGRVHRYLLSPKITQFVSFVFGDLPKADKPNPRVNGIHYVYTSDQQTALLVAYALTRYTGLAHLKSAQQYSAEGAPYFIMLDDVRSSVDLLSGFRTSGVGALMALASADDNKYGEKIKVVIATKKSFKGVDLRHVRYLHLLDPLVNFRDFIQFVGRGPRYCSHSGHGLASRFVEVILYRLANRPEDACSGGAALPDCFLWQQSYARYFGEGSFSDVEDNVLWPASVDFALFKDNLHRSRSALKQMIDGLRCNAARPVTANGAAANNAADERTFFDGFAQLEAEALKRMRNRAIAELQKQRPAIASAERNEYKKFKKDVTRVVKNLDRRQNALQTLQADEAYLRQRGRPANQVNQVVARRGDAQAMANAARKALENMRQANQTARQGRFTAMYDHESKLDVVRKLNKYVRVDVLKDDLQSRRGVANILAAAPARNAAA